MARYKLLAGKHSMTYREETAFLDKTGKEVVYEPGQTIVFTAGDFIETDEDLVANYGPKKFELEGTVHLEEQHANELRELQEKQTQEKNDLADEQTDDLGVTAQHVTAAKDAARDAHGRVATAQQALVSNPHDQGLLDTLAAAKGAAETADLKVAEAEKAHTDRGEPTPSSAERIGAAATGGLRGPGLGPKGAAFAGSAKSPKGGSGR